MRIGPVGGREEGGAPEGSSKVSERLLLPLVSMALLGGPLVPLWWLCHWG